MFSVVSQCVWAVNDSLVLCGGGALFGYRCHGKFGARRTRARLTTADHTRDKVKCLQQTLA